MSCLLEFAEDHIESLHQTNLFTFQLLELITKTALSISNIALIPKSCGGRLLPSWHSRVGRIARVLSIVSCSVSFASKCGYSFLLTYLNEV
jgi:hypothetical protein